MALPPLPAFDDPLALRHVVPHDQMRDVGLCRTEAGEALEVEPSGVLMAVVVLIRARTGDAPVAVPTHRVRPRLCPGRLVELQNRIRARVGPDAGDRAAVDRVVSGVIAQVALDQGVDGDADQDRVRGRAKHRVASDDDVAVVVDGVVPIRRADDRDAHRFHIADRVVLDGDAVEVSLESAGFGRQANLDAGRDIAVGGVPVRAAGDVVDIEVLDGDAGPHLIAGVLHEHAAALSFRRRDVRHLQAIDRPVADVPQGDGCFDTASPVDDRLRTGAVAAQNDPLRGSAAPRRREGSCAGRAGFEPDRVSGSERAPRSLDRSERVPRTVLRAGPVGGRRAVDEERRVRDASG